MECHDGYLMIAVDLNFTGKQPRFEAVGESHRSVRDFRAGLWSSFIIMFFLSNKA